MLDESAVTDGPRRLLAAGLSDTGLQRSNNEDVILCKPEHGIFAVIDGVGGAVAGETGARTAAEVLERRLVRRDAESLDRLLREAVALANNRIFDLARRDRRLDGMSCVLTVGVVAGNEVVIGHVGDTRLYRLRAGQKLEKLTRDHSPVGRMEDDNEISEVEAMRHPRRNEIFRDVGTAFRRPEDADFVEVFTSPFEPGDALLLCSDGLTDQVPASTIQATFERHAGAPERVARELIDLANAAGGKDNVSVVVVEGEEYARSIHGRAPRRRGVKVEAGAAGAPRSPEDTHRLRLARRRPDEPGSRAQPPTRRKAAQGSRSGKDEAAEPESHRRPSLPATPARQRQTAAYARRAPAARVALAWVALVVAVLTAGVWAANRFDLVDKAKALLARGNVLEVGADKRFSTIGAALSVARSGQRIRVEPGVYTERLELLSGVVLESVQPREAVLRLAREGTLDEAVAVSADGIENARLVGFRIEGDFDIGVRLQGSRVEVENLEISGATQAAIVSTSSDTSVIRYSHLHGNPGSAIRVSAPAAPRFLDNLIRGNGAALEGGAVVEVEPGAAPMFVDNVLEEHAGVLARLPRQAMAEEFRLLNELKGEARNAVVVVEGGEP